MRQAQRKRRLFQFNSTYGYCDDPKCKKQQTQKLRSDIYENIDNGDFGLAFDLLGDDPDIMF